MSHWQYQDHVEPVLPPRAVPTQWYPSLPDAPPSRQLGLPLAVLLAVSAFVPVVAAAEVVTVDKWHPALSQPTRTRPVVAEYRTGAESPVRIAPAVSVILDWAPALERPVQARHVLRLPLTVEEPIKPWTPPPTMEQWYPVLPVGVLLRAPTMAPWAMFSISIDNVVLVAVGPSVVIRVRPDVGTIRVRP